MSDNVAKNLKRWDKDHAWPEHGDEWNRQAAACGIAYPEWKESLVAHLIAPNVTRDTHVLEIAPGHGRWTEYLAARAGKVIAVDLSPSCIEHCRQRFAGATNIDYYVTDGMTLPDVSADFVWSFDAFVHMDRDVIASYLKEIARVLKPGGGAVVHHSNVADLETHTQAKAEGWRAPMTADLFAELARDAGLIVEDQFVYWNGTIGVPRLGDRITRLSSPRHGPP
ncbi:MAG TPA: class I SAM-dependent methyltransferase [Rhizomicrobium sp.]|nr:class I SAM-dependent methyltransferase [Rhizomicrobium sp.]